METFNNLKVALDNIELFHYNKIVTSLRLKSLSSSGFQGSIQVSALVDPSSKSPTFSKTVPLPVIVAVGINYTQKLGASMRWVPYMPDKLGNPTVVDNAAGSMLNATDYALAAFDRNVTAWTSPVGSSSLSLATSTVSGVIPKPRQNYLLVAANFCPFITLQAWSELGAISQRATLKAWPIAGYAHPLDDLHAAIGGTVDLWIGHGSTYVWSDFDLWRRKHGISTWMQTYNLSGLGLAGMKAATNCSTHPYHALYK